MKNFTILLVLIVSFSSCKQDKKEEIEEPENTELNQTENKNFTLKVNKIDSTQFPGSIKYEGFIKNAVRWR